MTRAQTEQSPRAAAPTGTRTRIGVTVSDMSSLIAQGKEGMAAYAAERAIDLVWQSAGGRGDVQESQVEQLIEEGVDAIVVAPAVADSLGPQLTAAADRDIPVIAVNTGLSDPSGLAATVLPDDIGAGEEQMKLMAGKLGGQGAIVILKGSPGSTAERERTRGIENVLANYPGITVLAAKTANWHRDDAAAAMREWLSAHGDRIDGVVAQNDDMGLGAVQALEEAGRSVPVVGIDGIADGLRAVQTGHFIGTFLQHGRVELAAGLAVAARIARGEQAQRAYTYTMPAVTRGNVAGVLDHVVTEKDRFLQQIATLTDQNLRTGDLANESPRRRWINSDWLGNFLLRHSMVLVMLLVIAYFSYRSYRFSTLDNWLTIALAAAPFALIALGQTLVILTGGIDLSVGSVIAVSAMTSAATIKAHPDQLVLAVLVALASGLLAGAVNGFLVARVNVPPFIATLGMLTAGSGLAYVIGDGAPINGLPPSFGKIANSTLFGIQAPVLVMIAGVAVFAVVMSRTSYGMRIYAVGGNRTAAELAGVKSRRVLFSVYVISGLLAGMSGVLLASRVISGPPNLGSGYELDAIAAVVIGGASLMGGRGSIWGTILGLFLIQTLNNGLDILTVPAYWQQVIKGVLIAAAVAVDVWATKRRAA
ncbi:substrate-binding domain-containing protein [Amycolatopsis alkalitolerans]|uniref:Substrate-binding domain-containing protein n=1 Tax=Amycolatopsis alkalitolerans TaxID=2547244 RepID=A0A5C4MDG9_9PSEU|nr:substrate-binding domain-containing protein [Amycolatopsis alkalitolerans]TNC29583.1 substrate-binding domain-containing protein [Amycolatopsis alkalitolerans]